MLNALGSQLTNILPASAKEASRLAGVENTEIYRLIALAGIVNHKYFPGGEIELCSIVNARSGLCGEDCTFCAQSSHYHTGVKTYPLLEAEKILRTAIKVEKSGIKRFSIVTSGRGIASSELEIVLRAVRLLKRETNLCLCASLGIIDEQKAALLKEAGLSTYHHNLETAPAYFNRVCTTHTYQERIETIQAAQRAGLRVCAGGILGLGESPRQQAELALELKKLNIDSVPLNFLNSIPGTPLQNQKKLTPLQILRAIAIFRLVLPGAVLRLCGGRKEGLKSLQPLAFLAGANGLMAGDYLTTGGESLEHDRLMLQELNLNIS